MSYLDEFTEVYEDVLREGKPPEDDMGANAVLVPHISKAVKMLLKIDYRWHDGREFSSAVEGYNALFRPTLEHAMPLMLTYLALGVLVGREDDSQIKQAKKTNDWSFLTEWVDDGIQQKALDLAEKLNDEPHLVERLREIITDRGESFVEDTAMEALPPEAWVKFWDCFVMLFEAASLVFFNVGVAMGRKETGTEEFDSIVQRLINGEGLADS